MIMLLIVAAVVFAYYGGASCPKVLKDNKQMLLGVVVGLLLGSFFGVRIEGFGSDAKIPTHPHRSTQNDSNDGMLNSFLTAVGNA